MLLALPLLGLSSLAEEPAFAQRRPNILQQLLERAQQEARRKREAPRPAPQEPIQQNRLQRSAVSSSVALCDNQASHPDDPMKRGAGIADEDVDLVNALDACTKAVSQAQPADSPRIMFQTGRVLWLAEEFEEAMPFLLDAAEANEPAAMAYLGDAYANGLGGADEDRETALTFYTQAAQAGFAPANEMADELAAELAEAQAPVIEIAATTPQQVNDCDRLAANPSDPKKLAPGVADDALDTEKAVPVCAAAASKFPDVARIDYQYGRALYLSGEVGNALPILASSAEKGYPAAKALLGDVYLEGLADQPQDLGAAYTFYKEAAAGGYVAAAPMVKELENSLGASQTANAATSKLKLSCEVLATYMTPQEVLQYLNFKFGVSADFAANKATFSGDIPAFNQVGMYKPGQAYEITPSETAMKIQVDPFGPKPENNFVTISFDDGKIYMLQGFQ